MTAQNMFYLFAALNTLFFLYLCFDEKAFRVIKNYATYQKPERVKATPGYVRLRNLYDPETGTLAATAKLQSGMSELIRLCDEAQKGDVEAYYLASALGDMLRAVARQHAGSSQSFVMMERQINCRLSETHDLSSDRT